MDPAYYVSWTYPPTDSGEPNTVRVNLNTGPGYPFENLWTATIDDDRHREQAEEAAGVILCHFTGRLQIDRL